MILYGAKNPRLSVFYLFFWQFLNFFFFLFLETVSADSQSSSLEPAVWSHREIPKWETDIPGDVTYSLMNGAAKIIYFRAEVKSCNSVIQIL